MNNNYEDVVEINLRSLFFYVLSKWRWILVFFLVGAIAGGVVSYVQMQKSKPENLEKRVANIDVTNESVFDMEKIRQVVDYQKLYDAQVKRDDDSYILKMDPTQVCSSWISYYVYTTEQNIDIIDTYLDNTLNRDQQWSKLWESSGKFCSESAFRELVSVNFSPSAVSEQINIEKSSFQTRGGNLSINISAPDEKTRAMIKEYLIALVEDQLDYLDKKYPEGYSYEEISNADSVGFSTSVSNAIKNNADTRNSLLEQLNTLKKALNSNELVYYKYYYGGTDEINRASIGFSKKNPVIGAVIGVFLSVIWFAIRYVFDGHIKDETDPLLKGINLMADVKADSAPSKGLDKCIYSAFTRGKGVLENTEYIKSVLSGQQFDNMVLIGNPNDPDVKSVMDELSDSDGRLIPVGYLSTDEKTIGQLQKSEAAVLLLHSMKDYRSAVGKELNMLRNAGKKIIGTVYII